MKQEIEFQIIKAVEFIKKNSPKLHLYVAGKLLANSDRGRTNKNEFLIPIKHSEYEEMIHENNKTTT